MNEVKRLMAIITLFACSLPYLQAQCSYNVSKGYYVDANGKPCSNSIITAVPFLRIAPDARGGSMGDAGVALTPDANSQHYNSSKLAWVNDKLSISATYSPWLRSIGLQDVFLAYLAGYAKIGKNQTLGFDMKYLSLGDIQFTNDNAEPLGTGRPNEFEFSLSYNRKLSDNFAAGVTGRFINSNLAAGQRVDNVDIKAGVAGAADVSFTYKNKVGVRKDDVQVGLAISNLGNKISYTPNVSDFLPQNLGLGILYNMNIDDYNMFAITVDINKLLVPTPQFDDNGFYKDEDGNAIADHREGSPVSALFKSFGDAPGGFSEELRELAYSAGLEYWYNKQFAIRAGYFYENRTKGGRNYATVGIGLKYNVFGINLSYLVPTTNNRNPLDNTLRFSIIYTLSNETDSAPSDL